MSHWKNFCTFFILLLSSNSLYSQVFTENQLQIANFKFQIESHSIKLANGSTLVAWNELDTPESDRQYNVNFALKKEGVWTKLDSDLPTGYYSFANPTIASCPNGSVIKVIMAFNTNSDSALKYSISNNFGKTWTAWEDAVFLEKVVIDKPWVICDSRNFFHISYTEFNYTVTPPYYDTKMSVVTSFDQGKSWEVPQIVMRTADTLFPEFQVGPQGSFFTEDKVGNLYLTFSEYGFNSTSSPRGRIYLSKWQSNGSWSTPTVIHDGLNINENQIIGSQPSITASSVSNNGKYMIVGSSTAHYYESFPVFVVSKDNGKTWSQRNFLDQKSTQFATYVEDNGNFIILAISWVQNIYSLILYTGNIGQCCSLKKTILFSEPFQITEGSMFLLGGYQSFIYNETEDQFETYHFRPKSDNGHFGGYMIEGILKLQ